MSEENNEITQQDEVINENNTPVKEEFSALSHDQESSHESEHKDEDYIRIDEFDEGLGDEDAEAQEGSEEKSKGKKSIPEWAKKNPAGWAAKVAKGVKKEYEDKLQALEEKYKSLAEPKQSDQSAASPHAEENLIPAQEGDEFSFMDPEGSGLVLNANTLEGQQALANFELNRKRNEHKELLQTEELKKQAKKNEEYRLARVEQLKNNILEDTKNDPEIAKTIASTMMNSKNPYTGIIDFACAMQSNSTDFLYYLARNQKEWDRLTALQTHSLAGELLRHHVEYHSRRSTSSPPPPVSSEGTSIGRGNPSRDDVLKRIKARYEQKI